METDKDNNDFVEELSGISARTLLHGFKASQILKGNEQLKQQGRALDEALLTDKRAIKEVETYANALGNPCIIDNILIGGIEGSAALKHEIVEINVLHQTGWDIHEPKHIEQIKHLFAQSIRTGEPQNYIPFHLQAMKAELEYAQNQLLVKGIEAKLGMIAKALYYLDLEEKILEEQFMYTPKLEKMRDELDALGIRYPKGEPIGEELKNAL